MKKYYTLYSSISGGLYEIYNTLDETSERLNYIKENEELFKQNSMIFVSENTIDENNRLKCCKTIDIIEFNK